MKRLSKIIGDFAEELDSSAGIYLQKRNNSQSYGKLRDVPKEIYWSNIQGALEMSSSSLDYLLAKPLNYIEEKLFCRKE